MLNLRQVLCFLSVCETEHFARAAELMHITPTAMSKQIKALEASLEQPLFFRHTREVSLTPFGELFKERLQPFIREYDSLNAFISEQEQTVSGTLTILINRLFRSDELTHVLQSFLSQFPSVNLHIDYSESAYDMRELRYDMMIGFPSIDGVVDDFHYKKLTTVKNYLVAAPSLLKQYGPLTHASDIKKFPMLTHRLRLPGTKINLANGKTIACNKPIMVLNDFQALHEASVNGLGLFLSADVIADDAIAARQLVACLPELNYRHYQLYLFYRRKSHLGRLLNALTSSLSEIFPQLGDTGGAIIND